MNAITYALKTAGVKTPSQCERLWRAVKDYPDCTATQLASRVGISTASTSSQLSKMVERGMLETSTIRVKRRAGGLGGYADREVKTYWIHPRMKGEYELLPAPKKAQQSSAPAAATLPAPTPPPAPPAASTDIDHLTLGQARELYTTLHKLFGDRA